MELSLISSIFALNLVVLFSIVGIIKVAVYVRKPNDQSATYADYDGESTPASQKHFNLKFPKKTLVVLSVAGLGVTVALLLIDAVRSKRDLVVDWLTTTTWVRIWIEYTYSNIWQNTD